MSDRNLLLKNAVALGLRIQEHGVIFKTMPDQMPADNTFVAVTYPSPPFIGIYLYNQETNMLTKAYQGGNHNLDIDLNVQLSHGVMAWFAINSKMPYMLLNAMYFTRAIPIFKAPNKVIQALVAQASDIMVHAMFQRDAWTEYADEDVIIKTIKMHCIHSYQSICTEAATIISLLEAEKEVGESTQRLAELEYELHNLKRVYGDKT